MAILPIEPAKSPLGFGSGAFGIAGRYKCGRGLCSLHESVDGGRQSQGDCVLQPRVARNELPGYAAAEDRGFQMHYVRRLMQGRLAETLGVVSKRGRMKHASFCMACWCSSTALPAMVSRAVNTARRSGNFP
ncbi:MAG: penicillin acylase family protein [Verrucomicrobia bacterium]|nr:penicillin acylase family protein [Verrucomicrobiota bacterium]